VAADLHLHSTASDGTETPAAVVARAAAAGLTSIALTDHDNLDGIVEAGDAAAQAGLDFIPGTELSVGWRDTSFHLLVYHLEPRPGPLQDRLGDLQAGRKVRNPRIVAKLQDLGIDITYDEVLTEAGDAVVGRPHIAAVLVRKGVVPDMAAAFDRYLANGGPAYVERVRLSHDEAIDLAGASGAVPVVAHPHTLGVSAAEYEAALAALADAGVAGIECYYAEYPPEVREHLARLTADLGLIATGGSDYHGAYKPGLEVGTGHGDLVVPDDAAAALRSAAGAASRNH
jgi:predicted metal-dependent phosphoesterase TrpH